MKRHVGLFVAVVASGFVIGGSAFAGQLNALGQWMPTSTHEALSLQDQRIAGQQVAARGQVGVGVARGDRGDRDLRYRIDALGREVPIQTNLP